MLPDGAVVLPGTDLTNRDRRIRAAGATGGGARRGVSGDSITPRRGVPGCEGHGGPTVRRTGRVPPPGKAARSSSGRSTAKRSSLCGLPIQISFARGSRWVALRHRRAWPTYREFSSGVPRRARRRNVGRLRATAPVDRSQRHNVAPEQVLRHQRLDAGRRVSVRRARPPKVTPVITELPTYDRTLLVATQPRRRPAIGWSSNPTGSTRRALEASADRGRRAQARPHHPELPEPRRLYGVRPSASG